MTKSRKIYIGVMILAIGALTLDKTLLRPSTSKPQEAQAHLPSLKRLDTAPPLINNNQPRYVSTTPNIHETENFIKSITPEQSPRITQNLVSKLLNVFSGNSSPQIHPNNSRDLFSASEDFLSEIRLAPTNLPEPNVIIDQKPKDPVFPLKLTGIVIGPYHRSANINNEVIFLNQNIGPYTVVSIYPDSVTLALNNEHLTLVLDK